MTELRSQLEAALIKADREHREGWTGLPAPFSKLAEAIWPLVSEAVAAAEVRVAEQIAKEIEGELPDALWHSVMYEAFQKCAALARSVPGLLEGQTE